MTHIYIFEVFVPKI